MNGNSDAKYIASLSPDLDAVSPSDDAVFLRLDVNRVGKNGIEPIEDGSVLTNISADMSVVDQHEILKRSLLFIDDAFKRGIKMKDIAAALAYLSDKDDFEYAHKILAQAPRPRLAV